MFGQRISQTAIFDLNPVCRGQYQFFFLPKIFLFPLLQVEWKTHMVSFLENYSSDSIIVWVFWSRYSSCIKSATWSEVAAPLSLHFTRGNVSHGKKLKKTIEYLWHYSTDFHQVFTKMVALSGHIMHVTDDLENVGRGRNL